MKNLDASLQARILASLDLPRLHRLCSVMTAMGAVLMALPCALAWVAPQTGPTWKDEVPSLDWIFNLLVLGQVLAFSGSFAVKLYWAWISRRPSAEVDPAVWGQSIQRLWVLRFALCQGVCLMGALAFYVAYKYGFLTESIHVWWMGLLPLLSLAWMLPHWPDEKVLAQAFFRS